MGVSLHFSIRIAHINTLDRGPVHDDNVVIWRYWSALFDGIKSSVWALSSRKHEMRILLLTSMEASIESVLLLLNPPERTARNQTQ